MFPVTVFGPLLAVLYVGLHYLAFRDIERVRAFTDHFDGLVREARVSSRDWPDHLRGLRSEIAAAINKEQIKSTAKTSTHQQHAG